MTVRTDLGSLRLEFTERGVAAVEFCWASEPVSNARLPYRLTQLLQRYAAGKRVVFAVPVDLSVGTEFQRKVWRVLATIPYGETRSYAWVARAIGQPRAARAVGAACGANPVPLIIPCHRVVASDGSLGGFNAGLKWKKRLLRLEGGR